MITREELETIGNKEAKKLVQEYLLKYKDDSEILALVDHDNIKKAILKASLGKRSKPYVYNVIGFNYDDLEDEENKLELTICHIQLMILTNSFVPKDHKPMIVRDRSSNKEREIIKPDFEDEQIIHHIIIQHLYPKLVQGMYKYSCASVPKRGIHYVRNYVWKIIKKDHINTKYVLKIDIRKFFESIPIPLLKDKIRDIEKNKYIRELIYTVLDSSDKGLPLGYYTSQWFANFYLQDLDHYIKERILVDIYGMDKCRKLGRYGAIYYIRYMDDIVIFGPNKKELHKMKDQLDIILEERFSLQIKGDWQVFRFSYYDKNGKMKGRALDFVGFKFYYDRIKIRRRIYRKIIQRISTMQRQKISEISFHEACSFLSYYGFIKYSDAKRLYTDFLRPYVTLKDLKKIISKHYKLALADKRRICST